jgi:putative NADH-flavin reductase
MSKIAIIGATGRAGSQLLEEALRRGHSVTAIARNPASLQGRDGVNSVALDVSDAAALGTTWCSAQRTFPASSRRPLSSR